MFDLGGPVVSELLEWAQASDRSRAARRARVTQLLEPYLPWLRHLPVVKIAGTNGKGSVCAMLSAALRRDGRRPALFTSPHLVRVTERFRVDDREVDADTLDAHAARVLAFARELVRRRGEAWRPSFFEALLGTALDLFRDAGVDVLVCEAGVGGAHDATSLLPGDLGAVTTLSLDHQDVLGDTLEAIAADKAGIVGPGAHLVLGPRIPPELLALVAAHAPGVTLSRARTDSLRAVLHGAAPTSVEVDLEGDGRGPAALQRSHRRPSTGAQGRTVDTSDAPHTGGTLRLSLPLLGPHQIDNFATVLELARQLVARGVLRDLRSLAGIEATLWPGRLELRAGPPRVLLDAAHNVEGLQALARALDHLAPHAARLLAFGMSSGKDATACAALVPHIAPAVVLVEGFHRARPVSELRALLPAGSSCRGAFATPRALVDFVTQDAGAGLHGATLVAAGSIFMVGDVERGLDRACATTLYADAPR